MLKKRRRIIRKRRFRRGLRRKMAYAMKSGTKMTRFNGIVYHSFHNIGTIVADLVADNASLGIGWGDNGVSNAKNVYIDDNSEFLTYLAFFS